MGRVRLVPSGAAMSMPLPDDDLDAVEKEESDLYRRVIDARQLAREPEPERRWIVEGVIPDENMTLGTGDLFGEMALLTGMTRQADVVAVTYCRLLVLRKVDFDRFMQDNRDIRLAIHKIAASRSLMNRSDKAAATS